MKQLHPLQREILKKLLFAKFMRYSELKPDIEIENSKFNFHLKKTIEAGYVEKDGKSYGLTDSGKEYANRMDTDNTLIQKQGKISAVQIGCREKSQKWEFLIYTRLKHPFYGGQGFPAGKVQFGETVYEATAREFQEETGYSGDPELIRISHFINIDKVSKNILEDKFMFFFRVINPNGELIPCKEGRYEWVQESELFKYLKNPFESLSETLKYTKLAKDFDGSIEFHEEKLWPDNF